MRKLLICQYSLKYYAVIFVKYVLGSRYDNQYCELLDKTELMKKTLRYQRKRVKKNGLASK